MGRRNEQCDKVCRILDNVLNNRPTERDSLIVAVRKAFNALERQRWIPVSERLPEDTCGCLVTVGFENGLKLVLPSIYTKYDPKETFSIGGSGRVVEAWKPYPEPYKGVER